MYYILYVYYIMHIICIHVYNMIYMIIYIPDKRRLIPEINLAIILQIVFSILF